MSGFSDDIGRFRGELPPVPTIGGEPLPTTDPDGKRIHYGPAGPGWMLHVGDALAVLADMPDEVVDAVITDPPYSSGGMIRSDRTGQNTSRKYMQSDSGNRGRLTDFGGDNRDQRSYQYWCALWLAECLRVTKPGGVLVQFTDWRQLPATTDAVQAGGWVWRGIVPWHKPTARPQSGRFTASCEYVVWGSRGAMPVDYSARVLPGFYSAAPPRDREHITQKPLSVMRDLVQIVPPGGTVLDPFAGSGTTGCAALLEGREFIGVEQVPAVANVASDRLTRAAGGHIPDDQQGALL